MTNTLGSDRELQDFVQTFAALETKYGYLLQDPMLSEEVANLRTQLGGATNCAVACVAVTELAKLIYWQLMLETASLLDQLVVEDESPTAQLIRESVRLQARETLLPDTGRPKSEILETIQELHLVARRMLAEVSEPVVEAVEVLPVGPVFPARNAVRAYVNGKNGNGNGHLPTVPSKFKPIPAPPRIAELAQVYAGVPAYA